MKLVAGSIIAMAMLFVPASASALDLSVRPLHIDVDVPAGASVTRPITVSSQTKITVQFEHADLGYEGVDYRTVLIDDTQEETTAFSTRGWFSVPRATMTVRPGEPKVIPLRIEVPDDTPSGAYLGVAFIRTVPDGKGQIQPSLVTGPVVTVNVAGGDPPEPEVSRFDLPRIVTDGPLEPKVLVGNRGDGAFRISGKMRIRGNGVDESIDLTERQVIPDRDRRMRPAEPQREPGIPAAKPKPYRVGPKHLGFGRYTVTTQLRVTSTNEKITVERTVWVVPIWMRIAVSALLVCAAILASVLGWRIRAARRSR